MKREEALKLPVNTRVRAELYVGDKGTKGTVIKSKMCGHGVVFDGYPYVVRGDCHAFRNMSGRMLETLEVLE